MAPAIDSDLAAVRKLLKENLPTGKWEEIRWWPKRLCKRMPHSTKPLFEVFSGTPWALRSWEGRHICRLKYRTQNQAGGMEVVDQVFAVENGGIQTLQPYGENPSWLGGWWHSLFPNDRD